MTVQIVTNADKDTGDAVTEPVVIETEVQDTDVTTVEDELDSDAEDNEWADLAEESDDDDDIVEDVDSNDGEPADQEDVTVDAEPEDTTAEGDEVVTAEVEAVAETEDASQVEDVVVAEAPEEVVQQTPEERETVIAEARSKALGEVEQQFQLTEDEADDLIADPNTVLPKMLAKVYIDVFTSVMQGMQQQLPNMITNVVKSEEQGNQKRNAFYGAWPQLNKAEHKETVERIGGAYMQMNPKATQEDFVKEVGAQAWVALRLPLEELLQHTEVVPAGEVATPVTNGGRKPAGPGNASVKGSAPAPKQKNEYEALADELLAEDN